MPTETPLMNWPTPEALTQELSSRLDGFQGIGWTAQTGSTNADLLAQARYISAPLLLGTHQQTTGRGRAGRPWKNRLGATLMFSCALPVQIPVSTLPLLSPLAGLIAAEALRTLANHAEPLRVKWPNDLQWYDAKLAGILVESVRNHHLANTYTAVIGMGLNLIDASQLSETLGRSVADWATIRQETSCAAASIADIVCTCVNAWRQAIQELETHGFEPFRQRFDSIDALAGREVNVIDKDIVLFSGIAQGIDKQGRLLVQTATDRVPVSVGEISIRPRTSEHTA